MAIYDDRRIETSGQRNFSLNRMKLIFKMTLCTRKSKIQKISEGGRKDQAQCGNYALQNLM